MSVLATTYGNITPEAAYATRGLARIVDVRESHELVDGIIPGADHAPLGSIDVRAVDWPREEEIILVCRSGVRSARAAAMLVRRGFLHVMNMTGGMRAYTAAGLPIARRSP